MPPTELGQKVISGYDSFELFKNIGAVRGLIYSYSGKAIVGVLLTPFM